MGDPSLHKHLPDILSRLAFLRSAHDEESFAGEVARAAISLFGGGAAAVYWETPEGWKTVYLPAGPAVPAPGDIPGVLPKDSAAAQAIREGAFRSLVPDATAVALAERARCEPMGGPSMAACLRGTAGTLGAIQVIRRAGETPFEDIEARSLESLGGHVAGCLAGFRARHELLERNEQLDHIMQASLVLNSTLHLDALLGILVDTAMTLTKADAGALLLREDQSERLYFKVARGGRGDEMKQFSLGKDEGIAGWVTTHGEPLLVSDAGTDPRHAARFDQATGVRPRQMMCVPLRVKEEIIGAMEVMKTQPGPDFTHASLLLLQTLASHAAIAVKNAILYKLAITDELTGLYSYRYFQDALQREAKLAEKNKTQFALVLLDVDHFKAFNDEHGHKTGDLVLQEIARVVRSCLRDTDIVARYGGEELVVTLREIGKETAVSIAERIRRKVEALQIPHEGKSLGVTCSIGVSAYPEDTLVKEKVFYLADSALYTAKKQGRNRVAAYSSGSVSDSLEI